ncbi:16S rRNA (adenine(1408)-N(1))-methyltransferase KamB [Actinokineospora sp. G85]|uniref:16S rRNA (adenine(1408)-N(1))-methyltransferase KamB n=1 Tax=Actinokineospora sp. G85 TaxID=3406626 RepID=UPI003C769940
MTGKQTTELPAAEFATLRAQYPHAVLDIGTGDGKHPFHLARTRPDTLVVGLDAAKDNFRKAATRAAAKPARGGLPNLLYVWAAAENLPEGLTGFTELHVLMPWGSLLRGVLGSDPAMLRGMAATCHPGATFLITLNLHAWQPPVPEVGDHPEPTPESAMTTLAPALKTAGWHLNSATYLTADEIAALSTSWTRRLNSTRDHLEVLALTGTIDH